MNNSNYRKLNDRSCSSSTYHKKDGTNVRAILKEEMVKEVGKNMARFQIGDKVKIMTTVTLKKGPVFGAKGVVEQIDGEYIFVRPNYYKHFIECYACELEKL